MNGANVTVQVAFDAVAVVVVDDDALTVTDDACLVEDHGHFNLATADSNTEVGIDVDLLSIADDRQGFASNFATGAFVVDHDAEIVIEEIADQEVAAFAGEFVKLLVESHVVLGSANQSVAAEWWHHTAQVKGRFQLNHRVHQVVELVCEVQFTQKVLFSRSDFFEQRQLIEFRRRVKVLPFERKSLTVFEAAGSGFVDKDRAPGEVERSLRLMNISIKFPL